MFVKYLFNTDLIQLGFKASNPINLHPESYHKMQINRDGLSTFMHIWVENNIYYYRICTDKESRIAAGRLTRKNELEKLIKKYFNDDYISYLERKNNKTYSPSEKIILRSRLKGKLYGT